MNLKLVDYLLLAAETGSFAKAASKIGMAQPTFGRLIARLEKECGARLLYRHGRGVALTKEGERFVEGIRPVISQVEILRGTLQRERGPRGNITVGMTPTKAEMFGLATVMAVRKQYPDIRMNVVCGFSGYVHDWLIDGSLDIALLNNARRSRQISVDGLAKAGLYLISRAGVSPLSQGSSDRPLASTGTSRRGAATRRRSSGRANPAKRGCCAIKICTAKCAASPTS